MKPIDEDTNNETSDLKQAGEATEEFKYTNLPNDAKEEPKQPETKLKYLILGLICLITAAM